MRQPCAQLSELRSAFVDGALTDADRDRVLHHLVGCAPCRHDIAELRAVRELLHRNAPRTAAPAELAHRLTAIAGAQAQAPLWSRPFGRARAGSLPSRRRTVRRRVSAVTVALGVSVASVAGAGYAAAPADLAVVADPTTVADAEFRAALGSSPLRADSLGAALLTNGAGTQTIGYSRAGGPEPATGETLGMFEARRVLQRAVQAGQTVSYSGEQLLYAASGTPVTARVQVVNRSGQGSQTSVVSAGGRPVASQFSPAAVSSRMVDLELLTLLERNYTLTGVRGSQVAGRSATLVEARRNQLVAGRWWVDDDSGVVVWQESFDATGGLKLSAGFISLTVSDEPEIIEHLPARLVPTTATTAVALAQAEALSAHGWACTRQLGGLTLVGLRVDRADHPSTLHLVYTDGLHTATVYQQHGQLADPPGSSTWDGTLGAYLQAGATPRATWQSGDTVLSVTTDGSAELLAQAVAALPHEPPLRRTTMERIQAGWTTILAATRD